MSKELERRSGPHECSWVPLASGAATMLLGHQGLCCCCYLASLAFGEHFLSAYSVLDPVWGAQAKPHTFLPQ